MFTGIIEEIGTIRQMIPGKVSYRVIIGAEKVLEDTAGFSNADWTFGTSQSRIRPIAASLRSAATTTIFFPKAPRPRFPSAGPPTYASSTSTVPERRSRPGRTIARCNLCRHSHAVL